MEEHHSHKTNITTHKLDSFTVWCASALPPTKKKTHFGATHWSIFTGFFWITADLRESEWSVLNDQIEREREKERERERERRGSWELLPPLLLLTKEREGCGWQGQVPRAAFIEETHPTQTQHQTQHQTYLLLPLTHYFTLSASSAW